MQLHDRDYKHKRTLTNAAKTVALIHTTYNQCKESEKAVLTGR